MKKLLSALSVILLLVCVFAPAAGATTWTPSTGTFIIDTGTASGDFTGTPTVYAGSYLNGDLIFKNVSGSSVNILSVEMKTSTDLTKFPFAVDKLSYLSTVSPSNIDDDGTFSYAIRNLRCRGDAEQNYYDIEFEIKFNRLDANGNIIKDDSTNEPFSYTETLVMPILIKTASASSGGGTTPKVIVTASSTNPSQVVAGEDFTLNVTFQNTSGDATASNIKAAVSSDGTFNPVSGSSTLYIDALGPKASATKSIKLHVKADAAPGSYNATFALSYDAGLKEPVTDTEVISIPVKQVPKMQVSKIQTSSSDLFVGQDLNVMASVNNTGKATLYNVNVAFTDKSGTFADGEQYLGNIQSGASGSIDVYLTALSAGMGDITMLVTYEDETGEKLTYSDTTSATASERTVDPTVDPSVDPTGQKSGGATIWIILAVVALAIAALIFFLNRRKKNKLREQKRRDRLDAEQLDREYFNEDTRV